MGEWLRERPVDHLLRGLWSQLADAPSPTHKDRLEGVCVCVPVMIAAEQQFVTVLYSTRLGSC